MKKTVAITLILCVLCLIPLSFGGCSKKERAVIYDPADYPETLDFSKYQLVFFDDFDVLDRSVWVDTRQGYRRDGYWTRDLAFADGDGHLVIRSEVRDVVIEIPSQGIEAHTETRVCSGALRTKNPTETGYTHGFGYYEIRCKLPSQVGMWHAFWMMCGDVYSEDEGSTDGIEIDVFEYLPQRDAVNVALHWDGYDEAHKNAHKRFEKTGFADDEFHTFGMNWDEDGYTFYIDGGKVWTSTGGGICHEEGYMKISTEVGEWGDWVGTVDIASLPENWHVDWVIDYVKVYDKIA